MGWGGAGWGGLAWGGGRANNGIGALSPAFMPGASMPEPLVFEGFATLYSILQKYVWLSGIRRTVISDDA